MKNARIVALMFVAAVATMSAASAQEAASTGTSHGLSMYEPAAVSGPAEKPSAVESGAKKVGSFFGNLIKTPVRVAQALAGGVKEGYSQPSKTSQDQGGSAIQQSGMGYTAQNSQSMQSTASSTPQEMRQRITQMFARAKGQAKAPVEDHSVSASSRSTGSSQSMSTSAQLSTWNEQDRNAVPIAQNTLY